jgi:TRAP transporter TAXI family solute receptor
MTAGIRALLATLAMGLWLNGPAGAQTVALGTTQGGATGQIAIAIAQIVTQHGGLQVRPQPVANTAQYIPPINAGQIEFGIANAPQTSNAFNGVGMSQGQAAPNLRMVGALFPFNAGLVATRASGMTTHADLKGKRLPWFPENSLGDVIMRAALETGGVRPDEVTRVPMPNFPRMFDAFKSGQVDVSIAAVGSQNTIDFQQSIAGGIRFLSLAEKDLPVIARWLPGASLRVMPPSASNPGIEPGVRVFSYAYTLFTHAGMADDVVHRVAKAMSERAAELKATSPLWEEYDPKALGADIGVPFHPGALRHFREAGIGTRP